MPRIVAFAAELAAFSTLILALLGLCVAGGM
jgi:hypothetical protein